MAQQEKSTSRLRFTYEDDLVLLREFFNVNPILALQGWHILQSNICITTGKEFLVKILKQHLQLLLDAFLKNKQVNEVRSGIEEPLCEKKSLLQEVSSLCQEYKYDFKEKKKISKEQITNELGKQAREVSAQNFQGRSNPTPVVNDHECIYQDAVFEQEVIINESIDIPASCSTPTTPKMGPPLGEAKILGPISRNNRGEPLKKNCLLHLNRRNETEHNIRVKELELEERRLQLEERALNLKEMEMKLREKEMDMHHKETMLDLKTDRKKTDVGIEEKKLSNQVQAQQILIDQLLSKNK